MSGLYHVTYALARGVAWLVRLFGRWRINGAENVPRQGPLLVVANHIHMIDIPIVAFSLGRKATFMAKEELFRSRVQGFVLSQLGSFPVHRGKTDLTAMRKAQQLLADGGVLIIFPEGTRSRNGELQPARHGAAMIAMRSRAPILPVGICGTEKIKNPFSILRCPEITVNIGRPFQATPSETGRSSREKRAEFTRLVMEHIAELLPREYRGIYGKINGPKN